MGYALDAPHPSEIDGVLHYMKVAPYNEADDDGELGLAVRAEDESALWSAGDGGDAVIGSLVAVVNPPGEAAQVAYGRVIARVPGSGKVYTIQVRADDGSGASVTEDVPRGRLQIFRTAAEVRAAAEEAARAGGAARAAINERRRREDAAAVVGADADVSTSGSGGAAQAS